MRVRGSAILLVATALVAGLAASAFAVVKFPAPGTASKVAALVAASHTVQRLPAKMLPPLTQVANDKTGAYYGVASRQCTGVTKCVFADRASKTVVVLFGDSHAQMWLPALVPAAQRAHDRLVLVWRPGCTAATITVFDSTTHGDDKACNAFRTSSIAEIRALSPKAVLIADRTSDIPGSGNVLTTDAAWKSGLEQTLAALKSAKTRVEVIGDITAFTDLLPDCLAAYPASVQTCSVPNPNPTTHQHFAAEAAAAAAEGVAYLNPQPWLCTKVCSPIIGTMAAYCDRFHVTATYAEYLSGVFATSLRPLLGP